MFKNTGGAASTLKFLSETATSTLRTQWVGTPLVARQRGGGEWGGVPDVLGGVPIRYVS